MNFKFNMFKYLSIIRKINKVIYNSYYLNKKNIFQNNQKLIKQLVIINYNLLMRIQILLNQIQILILSAQFKMYKAELVNLKILLNKKKIILIFINLKKQIKYQKNLNKIKIIIIIEILL